MLCSNMLLKKVFFIQQTIKQKQRKKKTNCNLLTVLLAKRDCERMARKLCFSTQALLFKQRSILYFLIGILVCSHLQDLICLKINSNFTSKDTNQNFLTDWLLRLTVLFWAELTKRYDMGTRNIYVSSQIIFEVKIFGFKVSLS